jgi:hypothetical protein
MKYFTLISLALACFQGANAVARCSDKCAMAIASDSNSATHTSLIADCQSYLGTTYYPTIRYVYLLLCKSMDDADSLLQCSPYCHHDRSSKQ